jgi:hypothetical protein
MTMIGQVSGLWPRKQSSEANPPFEDAAITWRIGPPPETTTRLTGIVDHSFDMSRFGCVKRASGGACEREATLVPYRALVSASLTFVGNTFSRYATAASIGLDPDFVTQRVRVSTQGWATSEGALPKDGL